MCKTRKIVLWIILGILILLIVFSVVASAVCTKRINEIFYSSSYSNGKDYAKYSENISKKDYEMLNEAGEHSKDEYKLEVNIVAIVLPHNLIFGKHTEGTTNIYYNDGFWIGTYYKFDIEFRGFDFFIKNVECDGAGMGW